jgi:hypothetical protein
VITNAILADGDVDNSGAELTYRLVAPPANGEIRLDGNPLALNGEFTQADVDAGRVTYRPDPNYNRDLGPETFQVELRDSGADGVTRDTVTVTVDVVPVNDAPVLGDTVLTLGAIVEDSGPPAGAVGTLVSTLLGGVSDVDDGPPASFSAARGVAVVGAQSANGDWFFSIDNGATWQALGAVSNTNARLLAPDARLYFQPDADFDQDIPAALTIRAWDQASGANGDLADASANGGSTAFSTTTDTVAQPVTPVNDAPVLADTALALNAVPEDAAAPVGAVGTLVSALTGGISDVDTVPAPVQGIAVTAADASNGDWFFSIDNGANWQALGAVSNANARLLAPDARIYFQPDPDFESDVDPALTIRAWDQTSGANGDFADTTVNGGTTAFSTATDTVAQPVEAINDAPVLADTVLTLNVVVEDAGAPVGAVGTLVSALTGGITDADAGALQGIAVIAADASNGDWFFSTNNGSTWQALGAVSNTNARLLAPGARIYFQPDPDFEFNVDPALTIRAWDQTSGANGALANASVNGGTTAFSAATDTVAQPVTPVNDAPVLADTVLTLNVVVEDSGAPVGAVGTLVSALTGGISDVDNLPPALQGIAVTAAAAGNGDWFFSIDNGTTWQALGAVSNANARLLAPDARVYFQPDPDFDQDIPAALTIRAWDQTSGANGALADASANGGTTAFSTATDTVAQPVTPVNDAPLLADTVLALGAIAEDSGAPVGAVGTLVSALTGGISDVDTVPAPLQGIAVTAADATDGDWFFSIDNGANWQALGPVSDANARLLAADARIYFQPDPDFESDVDPALTIRAWDQTSGLNGDFADTSTNGGTTAFSTATDTVAQPVTPVNDAPVLADTVLALNGVVEDAGAPAGAVGTLVSALTGGISDVDAGALQGIAVTAADSNGTWFFSTDNGTTWQAMGAVSNANARLLAPDARVYFQPDPDFDQDIPAALTVRAWDQTSGVNGGLANASANGGTTAFSAATDTVAQAVAPVNDAPVLADTLLVQSQVEDALDPVGPVGFAISALTGGISDVDTVPAPLQGIAIVATNEGNGTWLYTTNNGAVWQAVGAVSASSALLLADDGDTRLYFKPNPNFDGNVNNALTIRAWDQTSGTNGGLADTTSNGGTTAFSTATDTVRIEIDGENDSPVLDNTPVLNLSAVNEDATPAGAVGTLISDLVSPAPGGNVTDPDGPGLGIAVTEAVTTNGAWFYTTDGGANWLPLGAVANNSARVLAADADTRIFFQPDANFNGPLANVLTFKAWDRSDGVANGTAGVNTNAGGPNKAYSSASETASITVNPVNDAPVLADTVLALNGVVEDAGAPVGAVGTLVSALTGGISDVDAGALQGIAVTAADSNGTWFFSTDNGTTWQAMGAVSNANARLLAPDARVYFQPDPDFDQDIPAALTIRAWDQTSGANGGLADTSANGGTTAFSAGTDTVAQPVTAVNDAPVLDDTEVLTLGAVTEDSGAPVGEVGTLVSSLTGGISDVDTVPAPLQGIAVVGANDANGTWHFSTDGGTTWQAMGVVSGASARLLAPDARVYFQPDADFDQNVDPALTIRAWDQTSGANGGLADTTVNGGTTAFSTATDTVAQPVTAVNDAPLLDAAAVDVVAAAGNGAPAPAGVVGFLVSQLTPGISDVDTGAVQGIAVTATDETDGTWHFTTDGGATWQTVGAVAEDNALLLAADANTRLFFQASDVGTTDPALTFRAWDQTSGTAGTKADASATGGSTAFSINSDSVEVDAEANVAPALADTVLELEPIDEDAGAPVGAVGTPVSSLVGGISDTNADAVKGIAITAADSTNGDWFFTIDGGTTWQPMGLVADDNARLLTAGPGSRVYFQPDPNFDQDIPTALTIRAWDQTSSVNGGLADASTNGADTAFSATTDDVLQPVNAINDAPVLTMPVAESTNRNTPKVINGLSVADIDAGANPITVTLTAAAGVVTLASVAGLVFGMGDGLNDPVMEFSGTLADINAALNGLTFVPQPGFTGDASITLEVNDGGNTGSGGALDDTGVLGITVVDPGPPVVLDLDGSGLAFTGIAANPHQPFDFTGDGIPDRSAWVGEGTGILAYDENGDGKIDQRSEIVLTDHAPEAASDLDALRLAFDTNADGQLTAADEAWSQFGVWFDRDGDGIFAPEEFVSLDDMGIAGISLESDGLRSSPVDGIEILGGGTFQWADGRSGELADVLIGYVDGKAALPPPAEVLDGAGDNPAGLDASGLESALLAFAPPPPPPAETAAPVVAAATVPTAPDLPVDAPSGVPDNPMVDYQDAPPETHAAIA